MIELSKREQALLDAERRLLEEELGQPMQSAELDLEGVDFPELEKEIPIIDIKETAFPELDSLFSEETNKMFDEMEKQLDEADLKQLFDTPEFKELEKQLNEM